MIWHQNHATKSVAYTTMVRPRLEYSSTVWNPHLASDVHTLEQVQRQAARFVHRNCTQLTPGCVTNMVLSFDWESLQQRRYIDRLSMVFKIQHALVDISPEFIQPGEDHSAYNSWRPTRTYTDTPSIDWNRLPIPVTNSSDPIGPSQQLILAGTQGSPSLPASHTPFFLVRTLN